METLSKHPAKEALDFAETLFEDFSRGVQRGGFHAPVRATKEDDCYWFYPPAADPSYGMEVAWGYSIFKEGDGFKFCVEFTATFAYPGDPEEMEDWGCLRMWQLESGMSVEVVDDSGGQEPPPHVRDFLSETGLVPDVRVTPDYDLMERVVAAAAKLYNAIPRAEG